MVTRFIRGKSMDGSFTDTNNLAQALMIEPEIADVLIYAYGMERKGDVYNLLQYLTQGRGAVATEGKSYKVISNDELKWPVMGHMVTSKPISGTVQGNGLGFSTFVVPFAEKYYSLGFVLRFEDGSQARIVEEPYKSGNNWCYTMQLMGNLPGAFVGTEALEPGKEVGWNYTAYEEGSEGGGMVEATPMWFTNQMSTHRTKTGMTADAKLQKIAFEIERNGKKSRLWLFEKQFQATLQHMRAIERLLWDGRYNKLSDGSIPQIGVNGRPVKQGSGIEEQLEGVNKIVTSRLTEDLFYQLAVDLSHNAGDAENKKVVIVTGHGGMYEFDQCFKRASASLSLVDTHFVSKNKGAELSFGAQFTSYKGPYGIEFTVINHPMFNDANVYTKKMGPKQFTDQSYKMFFLDFSDYGGESNIQMITKGANGENRQMLQWFTAGSTTPDFGGSTGVGKVLRSHSGDYFDQYTLSQLMVQIRNPLSCGMIHIQSPVS